jgi:hypothetical protein
MSALSMQHPSESELGPSASVGPVVGGSDMSNPVFGIFGIALALATVVVAFLQYRLRSRRVLPVAERDSDSIL